MKPYKAGDIIPVGVVLGNNPCTNCKRWGSCAKETDCPIMPLYDPKNMKDHIVSEYKLGDPELMRNKHSPSETYVLGKKKARQEMYKFLGFDKEMDHYLNHSKLDRTHAINVCGDCKINKCDYCVRDAVFDLAAMEKEVDRIKAFEIAEAKYELQRDKERNNNAEQIKGPSKPISD